MKQNASIRFIAILIVLIVILILIIFFTATSSDLQSSSQLQKSDTFNIAGALQNSAPDYKSTPAETAGILQNTAPQNQTRPFDAAGPVQNIISLPTFENTTIPNLNVGEYRGEFTWTDWIGGIGTIKSSEIPNNITVSYLDAAVDTAYKAIDSGQPANSPIPFPGVLPPPIYDPTGPQYQSPQ